MFALPRVLESGELAFDPMGPVPNKIPYFKATGPYTFMPDFDSCQERDTIERPLTTAPG